MTFGTAYPDKALILPLDAANQQHVDSAIVGARTYLGHIEVPINNAGFGLAAAI